MYAAGASASAQPLSDLEGLLAEPVVSGASKSAERSSDAPAVVSVVTAEDIRRYGLRSLNEVINYAALGMVTTNPLHSVEIGARGVLLNGDYGNHVLLLVDGHAVNEVWNGTAYYERGAGIPFELIDHVEFILGPGSVLYGSQAMLGVINVVTKSARNYSGAHVIAEGDLATADFESADLGLGYRAAAGIGKEFKLFGAPAELTFQAEYYRQDGPKFLFGPQEYGEDSVTGEPKRWSPRGAGTGVWGGRATRSYYSEAPAAYARFIVDNVRVTARASAYKRASPYLDGLSFSFGDFDEPDNYELDRFLALDVKHTATLSSQVSLSTRLYGDIYDYRWYDTSSAAEDCLTDQLDGCRRDLFGVARWFGAEIQSNFDWFEDNRLTTLLGIDGRLRDVGSRLKIEDRLSGQDAAGLPAYERFDESGALYLQQVARPTSWLGLNAGARADFDARFGSRVSPRAAATASLWRGGSAKAIYAEAFRAPLAYEIEYADPSEQAPARDLQPEHVRSVEAAFEQRFGSHKLLFGVFRSWWRDMVLADVLDENELADAVGRGEILPDVEEAYQYQNVSEIENYGYNAAIEGTLFVQRFHYALNVTSAFSRIHGPGESPLPLAVAPQLFGNARVSYDLAGELPTLALAAQFLDRRPADRAFDSGHVPQPFAPRHLQLRGTVGGPVPGLSGLSYRVSAEYSFASRGPYVIGPNQWVSPEDQVPAELSPVERARAMVGFQYDLPL